MSNQCIVKVDHFDVSFRSLFDHLIKQTKWVLSCLWALRCNAQSVYVKADYFDVNFHLLFDHLVSQTKWAIYVL